MSLLQEIQKKVKGGGLTHIIYGIK